MWTLRLPLEFDPVEFRGVTAQTQKLFFEILMDAIGCLLSLRGSRREQARLAEEARAWVQSDDPETPVTFTQVCDTLRLPEERLRALLLGDNPQIHFVLDRGHRLRRHAEVPVATIQSLVWQGVSFEQIAQKCSVPLRIVRAVGSDIRRQRMYQRNMSVRAAIRNRESVDAVAERMGLSPATVRRIVAQG